MSSNISGSSSYGETADRSGTTTGRTPVQLGALVVGVVFVLVGALGFVPGITSNYSDLSFMGHDSTAKLLGLFQVSVLHNFVHLLYGVAGIVAARTATASKGYLIGGGIIYLVLWIYGLIIDPMSGANFVPLNTADNWLHLGLGLGMIALGLILAGHRRRSDTSASNR